MSPKGSIILAIAAMATWASPVTAAPPDRLPRRVGECAATRIKTVETRLADGRTNQPVIGSGSAVSFTNGGYQVSYDTIPAVEQSRPGDRVRMCLVFIPRRCPPGDERGRRYRTTNLRTHRSWTLPDAQHECGGA